MDPVDKENAHDAARTMSRREKMEAWKRRKEQPGAGKFRRSSMITKSRSGTSTASRRRSLSAISVNSPSKVTKAMKRSATKVARTTKDPLLISKSSRRMSEVGSRRDSLASVRSTTGLKAQKRSQQKAFRVTRVDEESDSRIAKVDDEERRKRMRKDMRKAKRMKESALNMVLASSIEEALTYHAMAMPDKAREVFDRIISSSELPEARGKAMYWLARARVEEDTSNYSAVLHLFKQGFRAAGTPVEKDTLEKGLRNFTKRLSSKGITPALDMLMKSPSAADGNDTLILEDGEAGSPVNKKLSFSALCDRVDEMLQDGDDAASDDAPLSPSDVEATGGDAIMEEHTPVATAPIEAANESQLADGSPEVHITFTPRKRPEYEIEPKIDRSAVKAPQTVEDAAMSPVGPEFEQSPDSPLDGVAEHNTSAASDEPTTPELVVPTHVQKLTTMAGVTAELTETEIAEEGSSEVENDDVPVSTPVRQVAKAALGSATRVRVSPRSVHTPPRAPVDPHQIPTAISPDRTGTAVVLEIGQATGKLAKDMGSATFLSPVRRSARKRRNPERLGTPKSDRKAPQEQTEASAAAGVAELLEKANFAYLPNKLATDILEPVTKEVEDSGVVVAGDVKISLFDTTDGGEGELFTGATTEEVEDVVLQPTAPTVEQEKPEEASAAGSQVVYEAIQTVRQSTKERTGSEFFVSPVRRSTRLREHSPALARQASLGTLLEQNGYAYQPNPTVQAPSTKKSTSARPPRPAPSPYIAAIAKAAKTPFSAARQSVPGSLGRSTIDGAIVDAMMLETDVDNSIDAAPAREAELAETVVETDLAHQFDRSTEQ